MPKKKKPVRFYSPKRRAVYAAGEHIDRLALFDAYDWICHLCDMKINRYLRCPNLMAGTIDHIIPLCRGGTHTWDNVKPAHAKCNFAKGDLHPDGMGDILAI